LGNLYAIDQRNMVSAATWTPISTTQC
jgi:hypothetical protein